MQIKHKLIAILLVLAFCPVWAEQANDSITCRNVKIVAGADAAIYTGTIIGLNQLWFKDCQWIGVHTINDNGDWLQMDKLCHATTSYHTCVFGDESMRLAGLDAKRSALFGGAFSLLFMTTIEVMDGGYEGWGFSWGDMAAHNNLITWERSHREMNAEVSLFAEIVIGKKYDELFSQYSNNHLIFNDDSVRETALSVKRGDHIIITGSLVDVTIRDNNDRNAYYKLTSSLRRDDDGDDSCEVILVTDIKILD